MIAIDFPQRNLMLAEDQPEYETLPVYCEIKQVVVPNEPSDPQLAIMTRDVAWSMTACFQLNKEEIEQVISTGQIWHTQMLYGKSFQPVLMSVENPFFKESEAEQVPDTNVGNMIQAGTELIAKERKHQIEVKGYDAGFVAAHPDYYAKGQLADAAVLCLAGHLTARLEESWPSEDLEKLEAHLGIKSLVVAGALIAAEIDRLQAV